MAGISCPEKAGFTTFRERYFNWKHLQPDRGLSGETWTKAGWSNFAGSPRCLTANMPIHAERTPHFPLGCRYFQSAVQLLFFQQRNSGAFFRSLKFPLGVGGGVKLRSFCFLHKSRLILLFFTSFRCTRELWKLSSTTSLTLLCDAIARLC